MLITILILIYI